MYFQTVTPLNEECGLLEWVSHTSGIRQILLQLYKERGIYTAAKELKTMQLPPGAPLQWVSSFARVCDIECRHCIVQACVSLRIICNQYGNVMPIAELLKRSLCYGNKLIRVWNLNCFVASTMFLIAMQAYFASVTYVVYATACRVVYSILLRYLDDKNIYEWSTFVLPISLDVLILCFLQKCTSFLSDHSCTDTFFITFCPR